MKNRCSWVKLDSSLSVHYHDNEWGVPCFNDNKLFEMLILEGAQAGLSWQTVLKKRENYRKAFDNFNPKKISKYQNSKIQELLSNSGIIRNKLKINSAINNAKVFLNIQKELGSFSNYIWSFTDNKVIKNNFENYNNTPTKTELSDSISKDLKNRGMTFVGSTIIYAYLQAIGVVNNHQMDCFCRMRR
ncbi:MAG: DNA-3-methyladenine glycosylase I [Treponema sp.]|nr:MAG: DNA-3-methyladenine glycosylase I [Treponema sp.]